MGDRPTSTETTTVFSAKERETLLLLAEKAKEVEKLETEYEAINKAYDLVVALYTPETDAEFRRKFGGIADDYKMAKLRMEVAQDEYASIK
jgi:hypothetical protein